MIGVITDIERQALQKMMGEKRVQVQWRGEIVMVPESLAKFISDQMKMVDIKKPDDKK